MKKHKFYTCIYIRVTQVVQYQQTFTQIMSGYSIGSTVARVWRYKNLIITIIITFNSSIISRL